MNDEISHSIEIQDILHSQSLALVLENHFEHAVPLRSLQKSVFNQFRSCIRRQQRLKNLRFRTMVKDSIRLLLLSWRKLQIFCRKKKNENKATRWIQHFRLGRWLAKWKVTFAKFRRIRNFDVERERRFLLRGLRLFRTNSLQSKMCTKVEKIRHKKSSLLKMRWVFRSWKFLVERKLWNHIDDETVLVSERKIIPLTVALRKREVQDQRYSTIAAHKRLQTLFFGWKKIVLLNRRVLKDKVMVLDSLLTQRRLKHGLWSWLNIFNSQLFHRGKVRRRFWSRWKRFKSTKVYLIHLRNKAEMAYRIKTLYSSLTSWMIFRGRQKRLRDAYLRLTKFQVLKLKLRALMGWKFAYSVKCEEKSKEELSMMFYLSRLRKGTWNMWRQWYLARKSATCITRGDHQQPQKDRLDKGNDDSDTESMESITMKTDWTRIFRTRKALYR